VDSRQQRVAKNEALFRKVNERIEEVNSKLDNDGLSDFLCECGDDDCTEPISLTLAEYEAIRRVPTYFAIAPGHESVDVEDIISTGDRYAVVEKHAGEAARIAVESDPRP
jgi:hypothetical protein